MWSALQCLANNEWLRSERNQSIDNYFNMPPLAARKGLSWTNGYRESPAIWGYEWGNELGLNCHLPTAEEFHIKPEGNYTFEIMRKACVAFAREVHEHKRWLIISSGDGFPRSQAFNIGF